MGKQRQKKLPYLYRGVDLRREKSGQIREKRGEHVEEN